MSSAPRSESSSSPIRTPRRRWWSRSAIAIPLGFDDGVPYPQRVARARERTGLHEAFLTARASLAGNPVVLACMDFEFLGGSLGSGAGEIFARACELAVAERRALVAVCTSGGARMQEGIASLAQMARCSAAVAEVIAARLPYISILGDPCFGGVTASFAVQSDVIIAEPGARIGFAGGRVIEQATHDKLPDGFQTAEFLLAHGMVDAVVERGRLRDTVGNADPHLFGTRMSTTIETTERERIAFAAVELARHPERPRALQVIAAITGGWTELRGDRLFGDDRAVVGGPARLGGRSVMVIGQEKGTDPMTRALHNFGMPHPEGYRKAVRLMRQAEKFSMPVVCLVDTPAAHAGIGAEERGQAWAIADALLCMLGLRTPTVSVVLSEGGSGGALALALADRVLALENAVYTVAPPETCAAILYRDAGQRARAAAALRPGVETAHRIGLVDELIPEPPPGAHAHAPLVIAAIRGAVIRNLDELCAIPIDELVAQRQRRYRAAGD